jgi:hypothetical protein
MNPIRRVLELTGLKPKQRRKRFSLGSLPKLGRKS